MEEERRLCYVAITRAEKKLFLSWARYRRRFGAAQPEASIPSRFLKEVPAKLIEKEWAANGGRGSVDLTAERWEVRETARRNLYTGKTYNSVDNIRQFFAERGMPAPQGLSGTKPEVKAPVAGTQPRSAAPSKPKKLRAGSTIEHEKWGRGQILRLEGSGEDTKLTVNFERHGLKKLVAKYAGIKVE